MLIRTIFLSFFITVCFLSFIFVTSRKLPKINRALNFLFRRARSLSWFISRLTSRYPEEPSRHPNIPLSHPCWPSACASHAADTTRGRPRPRSAPTRSSSLSFSLYFSPLLFLFFLFSFSHFLFLFLFPLLPSPSLSYPRARLPPSLLCPLPSAARSPLPRGPTKPPLPARPRAPPGLRPRTRACQARRSCSVHPVSPALPRACPACSARTRHAAVPHAHTRRVAAGARAHRR